MLHLVLGHGLPCFKRAFQQGGPHLQPRVGRCATQKIEHSFQRAQRLARPIQTDVTEQAMFDGVPLRAPSGIVAHIDGQPVAIAQLLSEMQLKAARPTAIAASGISQDQLLLRSRIVLLSLLFPPTGNDCHRELGRIS